MQRWAMRVLVGVCSFVVVAALAGTGYQWLATLKDLAATPPPDVSSTSEATGCICGAPVTARLSSSSTRGSAARPPPGASSSRMSLDSPACAPTTGRAWATAMPDRRRGRHVGWRASWPHSSTAAGLADRSCSWRHPAAVSPCACSRPITRSAPRLWCRRGCLARRSAPRHSSAGDLRSPAGTGGRPSAARDLVRPARRYAGAVDAALRTRDAFSGRGVRGRRRRNHAHSGECDGSQERATHALIPVVVVTGARGADVAWHGLQRNLVTLSPRGCRIMIPDAGHVVAIDQPQVIVAAIRSVVEMTRGRSDVPLCSTPPAGG